MKFKEKLAIEWSEKNPLPEWTEVGTINPSVPAFIAGFETARKMAADLCAKKGIDPSQQNHITLASNPTQKGCLIYTGWEIAILGEQDET